MKKGFFIWITIISMIFSLGVSVSANDSKIKIYVNETELQCEASPFIENGRTMVPMRKIFEALNADVNWDGETQTVAAVKGNTTIKLQIGNSVMYNNGNEEVLDAAPVIVDDTTFVPVRAVSQSLNANVEWFDMTKSVYIDSPNTYAADIAKTNEMVIMYAPDGRTAEVLSSEVEAYKNVGWYTEPVVQMYAADGRTLYVGQSEVEAYKNVGWYTEPVVQMYAADGRTLYVGQSEVEAYKNVGWYTSPPQKASSSSGSQMTENHGSTVYVTPSGKKYHYIKTCPASNNVTAISIDDAIRRGYTPCSKCAK